MSIPLSNITTCSLHENKSGKELLMLRDARLDETRAAKFSKKQTVIIIGAGMAGVSSTQALLKDGYNVILIEARDVPGGRARTIQAKQSAYQFPLGPMYLHRASIGYGAFENVENPLIQLLKDNHFQPKKVTEEDSQGIRIIGTNKDFNEDSIEKLFDNYAKFRTLSMTELMDAHAKIKTPEECLAFKIAQVVYCSDAGINPELVLEREKKMSAENNLNYSGFNDSADHFIAESGGYERLITDMLSKAIKQFGLNLTCHFNHHVTDIDCRGSKTVVTTNQGKFEADAVICTIPLSMLKKGNVTIHELPSDIKTAIEHFTVGLMNKVFLEFSIPFWDQSDKSPDYINVVDITEGTANPLTSYLNLHKLTEGKTNTLIASYYADEACDPSKELRDNKDFQEQLKAKALNTLRSAYPEMPEPIFIYVTAWDKDPLALGSWTTCGSDIQQKDFDALEKGAFTGKLLFAGDYLNPGLVGNVHTAYLSGQRATRH